ncbi:MAG: sugar phosphate nucleotidyltransferase [Rickettsiales bacterium]
MNALYPVLLAGGTGCRLHPLSTPEFPKQFLKLAGQEWSLLQEAARTAIELAPPEQVITVTTDLLAPIVCEQLAQVDEALLKNVLIEPDGRGTAVAASVAMAAVLAQDESALLWLLPCDHVRESSLNLADLKNEAMQAAQNAKVVTFGATPHEPDESFGYVIVSDEANMPARVVRFVEKPKTLLAETLIASGNAYWNSGMFVVGADHLNRMMEQWAPATVIAGKHAFTHAVKQGSLRYIREEDYATLPVEAIDTALMEKVDNLVMIPLAPGWADVGTWPRLLEWWKAYADHITSWHFGCGAEVVRMPKGQRIPEHAANAAR